VAQETRNGVDTARNPQNALAQASTPEQKSECIERAIEQVVIKAVALHPSR